MKLTDYIEEKEVNKKIQKAKGIRGLIKKAVPLVLTATMVAALVGCEIKTPTPTPTPTPGPGQIVTPVGPDVPVTPDPPVTPIEPDVPVTPEPPKPAEVPIEQINAFIDSMRGNNFTYRLTSPELTREVLLDETVMQLTEGDLKEIYEISGDKAYLYSLNSDGIWTKNFAKGTEKSVSVYNEMTNLAEQISQATWESYDPTTNVIEGQFGNKELQLTLSNTQASVEIDDTNVTVSQVGATATATPSTVVDQTVKNIYEIVDGKKVFNYDVIYETIERWMLGDNQFGMDIMTKKYKDYSTDRILAIDCTEDLFTVYTLLKMPEGICFKKNEFLQKTLYNGIKDGTIKTQEEFTKNLNSIVQGAFTGQTIDLLQMDDCSVEQMKIINQNIFKELEEKGTRGYSVNNDNPETRIENFSKAEILFSFKGEMSQTAAGNDLGYRRDWNQYYIIKINNKIEFVNVGVVAANPSPINDAESTLDTVIKNNKNKWYCGYIERTELDISNEQIVRKNFPEVIYTGEKKATNEKSVDANTLDNQALYFKKEEKEKELA